MMLSGNDLASKDDTAYRCNTGCWCRWLSIPWPPSDSILPHRLLPEMSSVAGGLDLQCGTLVSPCRAMRSLVFSLFSMVIYEYLCTFDMEVAYFWTWKDRVKLSQILFFWNRYANILVAILNLYAAWSLDITEQLMDLITTLATLSLVNIEVMQALRLWHLFSHCRPVQYLLVVLSIGYFAAQWTIVIRILKGMSYTSLAASQWFPSLAVHSALYLLTILRAFSPRPPDAEGKHLIRWILRQGGLLASVAFAAVLYNTIGALSGNPNVSMPAKFGGIMLSVMSVTMSRLMFNIHKFSDALGTEPKLLLSHLEMSRIRMRSTKGMREGELLVEVDNVGPEEYELSQAHTDASSGETLEVLPSIERYQEVVDSEAGQASKFVENLRCSGMSGGTFAHEA